MRTLTRLVEKESDAYVLLRLAYTLNRLTGKRVSLDAKGALGISKPGRRRAFVETWLER